MKLKTAFRLTVLSAAAYGGYTAWQRFDTQRRAGLADADHLGSGPSGRQINARSELTAEESAVGSDDPVAQAAAILNDSDERSRLPSTADGIEHRRSEDTVEP